MQILRQTTDELEMRFPAELSEVDLAAQLAQAFLQDRPRKYDEFLVLLSLREALTNAVIHGSKKNPQLSVTCMIRITQNHLLVVVRDQGPGFPWRKHRWELPHPESESGRGLAIIRSCFDSIDYNDAGNELTFRKQLESSGALDMLQTTQDGSTTVVRITEDMVGSKIDTLRTELSGIIESGGTKLTIDLENVNTVDSLGMGLLVATHNSLKAKNGSLTVTNVSPNIYNVLTIMRLDKHFSIHKAV